MADEIFTVIQAAQYLQVCDKTVICPSGDLTEAIQMSV